MKVNLAYNEGKDEFLALTKSHLSESSMYRDIIIYNYYLVREELGMSSKRKFLFGKIQFHPAHLVNGFINKVEIQREEIRALMSEIEMPAEIR